MKAQDIKIICEADGEWPQIWQEKSPTEKTIERLIKIGGKKVEGGVKLFGSIINKIHE